MRKMRLPILLSLLLMPLFGFASNLATSSNAQGIIDGNKHLFTVAQGDPSMGYLGQMFGTVGNVLHGTSGQLLGEIFRIFNLGVLVIAAIFFIFTVVSTVTHSAYEGKFMGPRQTKPGFTILRTVFGFALLVPLPSGYSMIQSFAMWVVLSGVGIANHGWNAALDYFGSGGVVMIPPSTKTADNVNMAGTILEAQVCMYHHQKMHNMSSSDGYAKTFRPIFDENSVRFPSDSATNKDDAGCGEFTWDAGSETKNRYLETAMKQVITDTRLVAQQVVEPGGRDGNTIQRNAIDAVQNGAADWLNIILPIRAKRNDRANQFIEQAKQQGWLYAGMYYYQLTTLQRDFDDDSKFQFKITKPIKGIVSAVGKGGINFPEKVNDFNNLLSEEAKKGSTPTLADNYRKAAGYIHKATTAAKKADQYAEGGSKGIPAPNMGDSPLGGLLYPVFNKLNKAQNALINNSATAIDPVLNLQIAGDELMGIMTAVFILGSLTVFGISAGLSIFSSVSSAGYAFRDMLNMIVPLLLGLCTILFVQGMVMAVYIPMVPFIVFTFAIIGWFVSVIETVVAAPLVALGLTHHEGHDIWGRSEDAMWLLLNVFLRPILMIIGLIAGMLLSRIGMKILMFGYSKVFTAMSAVNTDLFFGIAKLTMFIGLTTAIVNTSYSIVHKLPDKVMRWLRSGGDQMGEFVQQATQATQRMAQEDAQARSRIGSEAARVGWYTANSVSQAAQASQRQKEGDANGAGSSPDGPGKKNSDTGNATDSKGMSQQDKTMMQQMTQQRKTNED